MTETGQELRENNEQIVKLMLILKRQRDEMHYLIQKQEQEKQKIQTDIEKLSFKLTLLTKSLSQRLQARNNYDKTIKEIESSYRDLVSESGKLLGSINKEVEVLEQIMDKKIGTQKSTESSSRPASVRSSMQSQQPEIAEEPEALQESEHGESQRSLQSGYSDERSVSAHRASDQSKTSSGRIKMTSVPIKPEDLGLHRSASERLALEKLEMGIADEDEEENETTSFSLKNSESDVKKTSSQCLQKCGSDAKRTSSGNLKRSGSGERKTSSEGSKRSSSDAKRSLSSGSRRSSSDAKKTPSGSLKFIESEVKVSSSGCLKQCESGTKKTSSGSLKKAESEAKSTSSAGSKKSESESRKSSISVKKNAAPKPGAGKHVDVKSLSHSSVFNDTNAEETKNWRSISDTEERGGRDSDSDDSDGDSVKPSKSQSSHCSQASSCSGKPRCSSSTSRSIKDDKVQDVEVQSFREAYGRQHTAQPPSVRRNK